MKKTFLLTIVSALAVCMLFIKGTKENEPRHFHAMDSTLVIPANVKAVIDQKCYGCHNPNSKNEKGKKKMNWDSLTLYSLKIKIKKLDDITEMLEKGKMPPEKFLQFKPEAKLTDEESKTLKDWAASASDQLLSK